MKAKIEEKYLIVKLPIENPMPLSKKGKSFLLATSHGIQKTSLMVDGKAVHVVLTAFINKSRDRDTTDDDE
jgi:hypothetical protein